MKDYREQVANRDSVFYLLTEILLSLSVLTLSVTVAMIRAFGTRRAVLVFFRSVTDSTGILI